MPRPTRALLHTTLLLACTGARLLAQDTTGVGAISGTVTDVRDAVVPDVAVCVQITGQCAVTENRSLSPFRADHYVGGLSYIGGPSWRVTLEGYAKTYRDYPVAAEYPSLSLANVGDTFNVREILFPLRSEGRGQARGVELFAEKKLTSRVFGQANLSVARARHAGRDGILRAGSFDYPVVANVIGGISGRPRGPCRCAWRTWRAGHSRRSTSRCQACSGAASSISRA